MIKKYYSI